MDRMTARGGITIVIIAGIAVTIGIIGKNFSSYKEKRPVVVETEPPATGIEDQRAQRPDINIHPRLAEIINTSKQQATEDAALNARLENFKKETGVTCINGSSCEKFLTKITAEQDIIIALKTISGSGVGITVWPYVRGSEKIYINDHGSLIIEDDIGMKQLRVFLGIKSKDKN